MLEKFIYENHLGKRFDGLTNSVFLNQNELRNYEWKYETINNRFSRFYRSLTSRKIPIVFCCASKDIADLERNRLFEITEADVFALLPGKIIIGDYYTTGFITGSSKLDYLIEGRYCVIELTLTSAEPAWYRESTYSFFRDTGGSQIGTGKDYKYDYPFDYSVIANSRSIVFDSIIENKFRLKIYGEATDPSILINGHRYAIKGRIKQGENLLIDSLNKTITLNTATGSKVNWFSSRNRESYIFEPIQPGLNIILYNGTFSFDLTIIEERSEPKWI